MNTIELVTEVLEILRDMDDAVDVILNLDAARLVKELECGIRAECVVCDKAEMEETEFSGVTGNSLVMREFGIGT